MSAICGICDFSAEFVDFDGLHRMGRAMVLRGREQSGAYLNDGVGILHNRMIFSGGQKDRQPMSTASVRGEKNITIVFDGEIDNIASLAEELFLPPFSSAAQAVLECYKIFGTACAEHFDGAFAFAVYDEETREVVLMRDRAGRKPLYYTMARGAFVFASEISGIQAYFESGIKVDKAALEAKMKEPYGDVGAQRIFPEIQELRPGSFGVYSRLGFENFTYNTGYIPEISKKTTFGILPLLAEKDFSENALVEVLRAFGYPWFHPHALQVLEFARRERAGKRILSAAYDDELLLINEKAALECADRIGMLYGLMLYPKKPDIRLKTKRRDLRKAEKKLCEMCAKLSKFKNPVSGAVYSAALAEKDTGKKIGMLGMILQAEYWTEHNVLFFV